MNDKILEAVKALGGDLRNSYMYRGDENLLVLCAGGDYLCVANQAGIVSDSAYICTISEFNTYAAQWLKEAYMHNAAIDLDWDVENVDGHIKSDKELVIYDGEPATRDSLLSSPKENPYISICTVKEFIDYCEANKPKPNPVFTQAMADAGEFPPVGAECMVKSGSLDDWFKGKCIGYDGDFAVFIMGDEYPFKCRYAGFEASRVKPIQSPRDKAIEAASVEIEMKHGIAGSSFRKYCATLYDAGYRKLTPEQIKEFDL